MLTIQSSDVYITQTPLQNIDISPMEQNVDVEEGRVIYRDAEAYEGAYEVTPKAHEQTVLQTRDKLMEDNVTVKKVPYRKVANPNGGYTVIIAKEVEN